MTSGSRVWKRWCDLCVATLMLVATLPLWLLAAVALLLTQGRPVIFRQQRVGWRGKLFLLYKFRTMIDAPPPRIPSLPVSKAVGDPRVTPLGRVLRRLAIDELPQLVNVLRGDMSLVGPRPLPEEDLAQPGWLAQLSPEEYARRMEWATRRHLVPPGLTGRWQVTALPETDFDNWIHADLAYVAHHSLWGDLLIVLQTPFAVLRGRAQHPSSEVAAACRQSREDTV